MPSCNFFSPMPSRVNLKTEFYGIHYQRLVYINYHICVSSDPWEIPRRQIFKLDKIGSGEYGEVWKGIVNDLRDEGEETVVAVKQAKRGGGSNKPMYLKRYR